MLEKKQLLDINGKNELIKNCTEMQLSNKDVFFIQLEKVIEERCDELDCYLEDQGYEIIHRDFKTVATNIYNYKVYFVIA